MLLSKNTNQVVQQPWSFQDWSSLENRMREQTADICSEKTVQRLLAKQARQVMRTYTTSFFIVSRFLPQVKREQVEIIYAAVRYPDEIVDTFPLPNVEKMRLIDEWLDFYEIGLSVNSVQEAMNLKVPGFLAAFTKVVRENSIPTEYYRSFLKAMRSDIIPRPFLTLEDLIENYIYGSAVVVGYFLTYVYGSNTKQDFARAMKSARDLGIALQLTNFLRDVREDQARGRTYLPLDMLREQGIDRMDAGDLKQHAAISKVIHELSLIAEKYYADAFQNLDAFSPDCRTGIHACIKVYRRLNERIASNNQSILYRESVPLKEKFQVLPTSKYWRIPLAYLIR